MAERLIGTAKGSGVEVQQLYGAVWTLRSGRVVRMEVGYADLGEALEAVGLEAR